MLLPRISEVHSKPMNAVKWPGSLYSSAVSTTFCHMFLYRGLSGRYIIASGNSPCENMLMISSATLTPSPELIRSYQSLPVGSARRSGFPASRSGKNPMLSEWSATTSQSSGRDSFTGTPVEAMTSSFRS